MAEGSSCAAFYLPASDVEAGAWAEQLIGKLGARVWTDPYGDLLAQWGGQVCRVEVVDADPYRILALAFSQRRFAAALLRNSAELSGDHQLALAHAFRDACQALEPTAGFVASQPMHELRGELLDHADDVAHGDLLSLTGAGFGLVYLRDPVPGLDALIGLRPRDELPVAPGRLLFGGKGPDRWWG